MGTLYDNGKQYTALHTFPGVQLYWALKVLESDWASLSQSPSHIAAGSAF
jgi:hypothetical protein